MKKDKHINTKKIIYNHILNNSKEYIIVTLVFIIGIFLGVMFINNTNELQMSEISSYINSFIDKLKITEHIDSLNILKTSILNNILLAIAIWFFGTTVIGIPVVFGIVLYRGFCLGYTVAAIVSMLGLTKGIVFIIVTLLLQNIIFIPTLLALAVSGFKLYKSIVKDRRKENIKLEVLRHTIFSCIMLLLLCISSFIEIAASTNILKKIINYF